MVKAYWLFGIIFIWWILTTFLYIYHSRNYFDYHSRNYYNYHSSEWKWLCTHTNWVYVFALFPVILFGIAQGFVLIAVNFAGKFWWLLIGIYLFVQFIQTPQSWKEKDAGLGLIYLIFLIGIVWLELKIFFLSFFSDKPINAGKIFTLALLVCATSHSLLYTAFRLIPKDIPKVFEWFLIEFFSIASRKRRNEIKELRAVKKQEEKESKKIQKALKKKNKEAKRLEKENLPKIPIKLDNEQIKSDISYLQTLPNKSYLIKYLGGIMDRFIAKGEAKTYQEIDKVIRAKKDVEIALKDLEKASEDLIDAQESRNTAKKNAEAKYLLRTLQAQFAVRKQYGEESLEDLRIETERKKLEAEREEAEKRKAIARKETANLRAPQPQQQQPKSKTQADRINDRARLEKTIKETIVENRKKDLVEVDERAEKEGWWPEEVEAKKDIIKAHWAQIEMEQLQKVERKFG